MNGMRFTDDTDTDAGWDDYGPEAPDDTFSFNETLEWHLNRIAWYTAQTAGIEQERDRMIRRYQDWAETTTSQWRRKTGESEAWIEYAMTARLETDPKAAKTVRLPSGVVRSVPARPSLKVDDLSEFEAWAAGQMEPSQWARWTCEPNKQAVKAAITDTGELVPGVHIEPGSRRVTITLDTEEGT